MLHEEGAKSRGVETDLSAARGHLSVLSDPPIRVDWEGREVGHRAAFIVRDGGGLVDVWSRRYRPLTAMAP